MSRKNIKIFSSSVRYFRYQGASLKQKVVNFGNDRRVPV